MLMTMLRGSRAILLHPAVATFEAEERNSLRWALVYVVIGATLTALLGALAFHVQRPFLATQFAALSAEFADLERAVGQDLPLEEIFFPTDTSTSILSNVAGTLVGFVVYLTIVFLLGRGLGGSGKYGELAYDVALFWVPISVISAAINVFSFSFFSCLTAPLVLLVTLYGFYLTFLSVQAGMNLSPRRALIVILVPAMTMLVFFCGIMVLAFALAAQGAA
jgi:hypothetical protein